MYDNDGDDDNGYDDDDGNDDDDETRVLRDPWIDR